MEEMKKSVKAALESKSRFESAATKAEPAKRESYEQIADGYHKVALISEMNVEALSDENSTRFRSLDPKK